MSGPTSRLKRSDVTTEALCYAIRDHGPNALAILADRFPPKVLIAAVYRDTTRGYVNYGGSAWRSFLDTRGRNLLANREAAEGDFAQPRELLKGDPTGLALIDFERYPEISMYGMIITREDRVDAASMRAAFRAFMGVALERLAPPVVGEAFGGAKLTMEVRP